ncbi:prephenate dehydrogenase/arogenate dehydrogenase family protein [Butyrivibrio sp. VCB2006]|uniref:prephenate dehydrogenase/arogenate dehydrogenase family protein n=1 Tax=Butyrivibrio sp. VCB2006 TaxID=1280679 RepID=UPI00041CB844|nr:prephenate dehydrogenase/arogenate dehydrogenase family protein [Butyrivibrio sp. VCB2006]
MNIKTYGFIGLGLIGGSMARAIKAFDPSCRIMAYAPHKSTVDAAKADGTIDIALDKIGPEFTECDYIFLCAPVEINNDNLELLLPYLNPKTTLTDIGSVKNSIHEKVKELGLEGQFIGGHPMTGTERIGYQNSKAALLENAYYILTRTDSCDEDRLSDYYDLVKGMGAIPLVVPYLQHDFATAAISHVPHVLSAALVNLVKNSDNEDALMKTIAAGGFKDITRISSSSPVMWQQICNTNSDNISGLLSNLIDSLIDIKLAVDEHDSDKLLDFFTSARSYRESFSDFTSGPIQKTYVLHVDISDQPGNLAKVAVLLSEKNVNIKNIGIVHNREYERGTLKIEFHTGNDLSEASRLLSEAGYTVVLTQS